MHFNLIFCCLYEQLLVFDIPARFLEIQLLLVAFVGFSQRHLEVVVLQLGLLRLEEEWRLAFSRRVARACRLVGCRFVQFSQMPLSAFGWICNRFPYLSSASFLWNSINL